MMEFAPWVMGTIAFRQILSELGINYKEMGANMKKLSDRVDFVPISLRINDVPLPCSSLNLLLVQAFTAIVLSVSKLSQLYCTLLTSGH